MHDILNLALSDSNLDAAAKKLIQTKRISQDDMTGMEVYRFICCPNFIDKIDDLTYSPFCPWKGDRLPGDDAWMTRHAVTLNLIIAQAFSDTCARFLQQKEHYESRFINRIFKSDQISESYKEIMNSTRKTALDVGFTYVYMAHFLPIFTIENEKILVTRFQEEFGEDPTLSHMVQEYLRTGIFKNGLLDIAPIDNIYYDILYPIFSSVYLSKLQRDMVHSGYYVVQHPGTLNFLSHEMRHQDPHDQIYWVQDYIQNELMLSIKDDVFYYNSLGQCL